LVEDFFSGFHLGRMISNCRPQASRIYPVYDANRIL
jgi:hypothetical protein